MNEEKVYDLELDGLFPESTKPPRVHGTAGEVLDKIAAEWGIEDKDEEDESLDGVYPSSRALVAHQMLEDQMGKHGVYDDPESLIAALIREGLIRTLTDDEIADWEEDEDMEEYEEARSELDDEWSDGVWES
ncbi:MAG TPA: hypothetical protein ENN67_02045 [Firmicutes bacterium]|nr:hypothetical protein [Bacillota bacterium]